MSTVFSSQSEVIRVNCPTHTGRIAATYNTAIKPRAATTPTPPIPPTTPFTLSAPPVATAAAADPEAPEEELVAAGLELVPLPLPVVETGAALALPEAVALPVPLALALPDRVALAKAVERPWCAVPPPTVENV